MPILILLCIISDDICHNPHNLKFKIELPWRQRIQPKHLPRDEYQNFLKQYNENILEQIQKTENANTTCRKGTYGKFR